MGNAFDDGVNHGTGFYSYARTPVLHPFRRPFQMFLVCRRTMLMLGDIDVASMGSGMRRHSLAVMKNCNGGQCQADLNCFTNQGIRDAVPGTMNRYMIVNVYLGVLPFLKLEAFHR